MPGSADIPTGNVQNIFMLQTVLSPAQVAINTTAEQTFTVNGLLTSDVVLVQKPTSQAGLGIVGARVSAANTLAITWANVTGGALTPTASETYVLVVIRQENPGNLPTAIV